jgi:hypothetical protein
MRGIDPQWVASTVPLWIAAGAAAALVAVACTLAFYTPRTEKVASLARSALILLVAVLCGSLVAAFFDGSAARERAAERRALEARANELTARALMPGSSLACLDAMAGDEVEAACGKDVFQSPANLATAIAYVAAQFALLSDMTAYADSGGAGIDDALKRLRRTLEADPFGLLAHVLATRGGCSSVNCPALKLLHDAGHVRTNLIAGTLAHFVEQYRSGWAKLPEMAAGGTAAVQPAATAQASPSERRRTKLDIDFPTAASIPPISIMNPEPKVEPSPSGTTGSAVRSGDSAGASLPPAGPARTDPVWLPGATATKP